MKDWAEKEGVFEGNKALLENYLNQNDIAQIICTSRQITTQLLGEMEANGMLLYKRKEIVIPDITKL